MDLAAAVDTVAGHCYCSWTADKGADPAAATAGEIEAEATGAGIHSSLPRWLARRQLPRPTLHTAAHTGHIAADCTDSDMGRDSSSAEAANIAHPAAVVGSIDKGCTAGMPVGMDRLAVAVDDSHLLAGCTQRRQKMAGTDTVTVTIAVAVAVVAHKPAVAVAETAAPWEEVAHRDPLLHRRAAQSHPSCPRCR